MGNATWSVSDYSTRSATISTQSREQVFHQRRIKKEFDPALITMRESCDSDENPESTAIIIGLDVTGSMGFIAEHIAKNGLGTLVESIIDRKPVSDPHMMMMAIGDIMADRAPLQVTEFEADIRIADQLTELWLEGGGGGNQFESYDLPWAFAAHKTKIDCFDKRGKKGYLFTIGDELPPRSGSKMQLKENLGITLQADTTSQEHLAEAQVQYEVFHIIVEEGHYASRRGDIVKKDWTTLLGKRAISLNNYKCISEVITSVIEVNEGADPEEVIEQWQDTAAKDAVRYALGL